MTTIKTRSISSTWILITALLANGCFFRPADTLRRRASYDLECAEERLEFAELGGNCGDMLGNDYSCTLAVRGCNRSATYVHLPNAEWIRDSSGGERAPEAAAQ